MRTTPLPRFALCPRHATPARSQPFTSPSLAANLVRGLAGTLATLVLAGCATAPDTRPSAATNALLHDQHFNPPPLPLQASDVLALSPAMRGFADEHLTTRGRHADARSALLAAMFSAPDDPRTGKLSLRYEAEATRTAAQTFDVRAGNCLSLVLMTAAFARHLGVPVRFQSVRVDPSYSRSGNLLLSAGHVNIALGWSGSALDSRNSHVWTTVDFLPGAELSRQISQTLPEATVLAMYMNNRAADALVAGRIDEGYAWVREALRQDGDFVAAVNTLAVLYLRRGLMAQAEQALHHVLQRSPDNLAALTNQVGLLQAQGRTTEAELAAARLKDLQDHPPYHFHDLGQSALARGDAQAARGFFHRELRRQPWQHESHHGLAQAYALLGDTRSAAEHLALARDYGGNPPTQLRYAAKLARLRGQPEAGVH